MSQSQIFSVGFGNSTGQTVITLLKQKRSKIELGDIKATQISHPKIEIKKFNPINLGPLHECIRKKRDHSILQDMLQPPQPCPTQQILMNSKSLYAKIQNQLGVLGALQEQTKGQKFVAKTKASEKEAQKYLQKYKNLQDAVAEYTRHQQIINKFMQQNQCSRENAIGFLESNDYQLFQ